jgi:hypothetical protein
MSGREALTGRVAGDEAGERPLHEGHVGIAAIVSS